MIRPPVGRLCRVAVDGKGDIVSEQVALFPLKTVLMPGCYLDLQIFEAVKKYANIVYLEKWCNCSTTTKNGFDTAENEPQNR